jgi:ABC-2 type transport system permease protein
MLLFFREISFNKKSFIIWTIALIALLFLSMSMFSSFSKDAESLTTLMESFPEEMMKAFNMSNVNFSDSMDYFSYIFQYVFLFAAIQYILLGSNILSKENGDKTIEFLYSKPITRDYILTSKLFSGFLQIIIFNILGILFSILSFKLFTSSDFNLSVLILLWISLLIANILYFCLGFVVSIFLKKAKQALPVSLGIVLGTYFLSIVASLNEKLEFLKYFSPFRYFDGLTIIRNEKISGFYLLLSVIIIIVCISISYIKYSKKDLKV